MGGFLEKIPEPPKIPPKTKKEMGPPIQTGPPNLEKKILPKKHLKKEKTPPLFAINLKFLGFNFCLGKKIFFFPKREKKRKKKFQGLFP